MANNIFANRPNIIVAKQTISFADAGFTTSNLYIIYKVANPMLSYDPSRGINGISGFEFGQGYYLIPKIDMDITAIGVPPFDGYIEPEDGTTGSTVYYNGDSITVGVGASTTANRWTSVLSAAKSWTEINNGLSGYVITPNECRSNWDYTTGAQAIPTKTADMRFLFISFGVNDAFVNPEITPEDYQATIEAAIDVAVARGWNAARCIVNSPFYTTFDGNSVNYCDPILSDEARKQLFVVAAHAAALAKGGFFIDCFNHMKDNGGGSLLADSIHPNDAGMAVIANFIDSILPD